jgi:hypothetical protein
MKKGLSTIVTVLILVSLTLVILAGVFFWMKNFSSKTQRETDIRKLCSEIVFDSRDFCYSSQTIYNVETGTNEEATNIKFNIRNEMDTRQIYGFLISLVDSGGSSRTISTLPFNEIEGQETKQLTTDFISNMDAIDRLKIVPEINSSNELIICNEQEKSAEWGSIGKC